MYMARPKQWRRRHRRQVGVCRGPVVYIGQREVQQDMATLRAALRGQSVEEAFITAISPTNLAVYYTNEFYRTQEEYLIALADAMNEEYRAIVAGGFVLQIDDPRLVTYYDRTLDATLGECRTFMAHAVEVLNHALLIPGVVSHCVMLVEHPELVAQRILRFASVLGPERVIASADCGFATAAAGDEVHPDVAWAKLQALAQGAQLATAELRRTA